MQKSRILDTIVPPITGLVDEAYPLVVALSHERPWQWFYSNYIQLVFKNDDLRGYNIRFYKTDHRGIMWDTLNPWIIYNIISMHFLKSLGMGIIDFIAQSIDNGFYLTVYLDRFYVPGIRNYQKQHMSHEAMVFGYDLENDKIHIIEYTDTYMSKFAITTTEFLEAYAHSDPDRYEDIHLLKFDEKRHYEFDLVNISEQLKDYLAARNTSERYRINSNPVLSPFVTFGTGIYALMRDLLGYNALKYDIRVFNSFWEHKKVMAERVKFITDNGFAEDFAQFYEPCRDIENKAYLLKSQFMKLCATKSPAALKNVYMLLDTIEAAERDTLSRMVEKIDAQIERNGIRKPDTWYPEHAFKAGTRAIAPVKAGKIEIEFALTALNDIVEGAVGYAGSSTQATAFSDFTMLLHLSERGYFEAMDGGQFRADALLPYARNGKYHVSIRADFTAGTYDVGIHDGKALRGIAKGFRFGEHVQEPTDIDKVTLLVENMSGFEVEGHRINILPVG
jgi:hypothetical protein